MLHIEDARKPINPPFLEFKAGHVYFHPTRGKFYLCCAVYINAASELRMVGLHDGLDVFGKLPAAPSPREWMEVEAHLTIK